MENGRLVLFHPHPSRLLAPPMHQAAPPAKRSVRLRPLPFVLLALLGVGGAGSWLAGGHAAAPPHTHPVLSAEVIERALDEVGPEAALPPGLRILRELAYEDGDLRAHDLELTPARLSRLCGAGMGTFLRNHIDTGVQASSAGTTTLSIFPSKDNTLYEIADGSLSNGSGQNLYSGRTGGMAGNAIRRAVLAFDVAAVLPGAATILGAEIQMYCSRGNGGSQPATFYRLTSDWGEGGSNAGNPGGAGSPSQPGDATWQHTFYPTGFWTSPGGDFTGSASASRNVSGVGNYIWSSAQLAADVIDMRDNPAANFGWILRGNEFGTTTAKRYDAGDSANSETRPVLRVEVTGVDLTPPDVTWISPGPGTLLIPETPTTLQWTASDRNALAATDAPLACRSLW